MYIRCITRDELSIESLGPAEGGEGKNDIHGGTAGVDAVTLTNETVH